MDISYERLRLGFHKRSILEILTDARTLGYRITDHGGRHSVHLQRGHWHAVKVHEVGSGVMVRKAWTTAQIISLGVVLTLIAIGVCASG